VSASDWPVSIGIQFHVRTRHWPGQVSCLHNADPSMM
jgi:hypothetical protein